MKTVFVKKKKYKYLKLSIVGIIIATFFWISFFSKRLAPRVFNMANIEANSKIFDMLSLIINDCVRNVDNSKLLKFSRNSSGELVVTEYDLNSVYELLNNVNRSIRKSQMEILFYLPIGIASNNFLINYWGAKIPVKTTLVNSIYANIKTKITNYGINNAMVEMYIVIEVKYSLVIPFKKKVERGKYEILISSFFINGKVPSIYGKEFVFNSDIFDINLKI